MRLLIYTDIAIIIISGHLVHLVRFEEMLTRGSYQLSLVILALLTLNIFNAFGLYKPARGQWLTKTLTQLSIAWLCVIVAIAALTFVTKTGAGFSRLWAGWTVVCIFTLMIMSRLVAHAIVSYARSQGHNLKHVVIIGAGKLGKRACNSLIRNPWAGLKPIAFFDDKTQVKELTHNSIKVLGDTSSVIDFIEDQRKSGSRPVDQVWIALPLTALGKIEELQIALQDTACKIYLVPNIFGFNLTSYQVDEVAGLPIMNMSAPPISPFKQSVKRFEDLIISAGLLVLLAPFFLLIGILIKLESSGPVFFKQRRYGRDGREILVWKFRTMTVTEDGNEIKQAERNDQRVTKIGAWLRKLSLDELPQLINVFLGTMSLVGPRPHAVAHNEYYRKKVDGYMIRHQIKPGITGLAQIRGYRGETSRLEDMALRVEHDLQYIRNWNLLLDIKILLLTLPSLLNTRDTY